MPGIVSFLPSATEIVYALGADERLVAVSHECDYPAGAREKPVVVSSAIDSASLSSGEIDRRVRDLLASGESFYHIDEARLRKLSPDLILTQDLCQVCAPSGNAVTDVLKALSPEPNVLWLTPRSLDDILENVRAIGGAVAREEQAEWLVDDIRARLERVRERLASAVRPRVSFIEWVDPIYCAGHWIPDMIDCAGGTDRLARSHADSVRVDWSDILAWSPEVLVIAPCGFDLAEAARRASVLTSLPAWNELPAVRDNRVFVVDANAYFARPGPRVVDGTELLAHLFHPDLFAWNGSAEAYARPSREAPV